MKKKTMVIAGGGAAGFFGAIAAADAHPDAHVILLEKAKQVLAKVRISGGGRCNVTHACFDAAQLVQNYPRGSKALRGPFTRFQPRDTILWFENRGVQLKVESDGRMFPVTDSSETIIGCLLNEAKKKGVDLKTECGISLIKRMDEGFELTLTNDQTLRCDRLLIATGSNAKIYGILESLGHTIMQPVPSLFTFNVPDSPLLDLSGISLPKAHLRITKTGLEQTGPLLLTHWGFSGPAVLKLSAWGARILHDLDYHAELIVNWVPDHTQEELKKVLLEYKAANSLRQVSTDGPFDFPKNLWKALTGSIDVRWAQLSNKQLLQMIEKLRADRYQIAGKSTYKEEFVTCGGVSLDEVDFKTMQSKKCPGLFFAGEVLDIDGVTGGFNFQNAWTTSWIAAHSL